MHFIVFKLQDSDDTAPVRLLAWESALCFYSSISCFKIGNCVVSLFPMFDLSCPFLDPP